MSARQHTWKAGDRARWHGAGIRLARSVVGFDGRPVPMSPQQREAMTVDRDVTVHLVEKGIVLVVKTDDGYYFDAHADQDRLTPAEVS